jgi:hypothetical protein
VSGARLLVVMGSGETAPTMVKVHRRVVQAVGNDRPGLLLDTPFGFQMNADELAERAVRYFAESVGARLEVAGVRQPEDLQGEAGQAAVARVAAAPWVFSGPGSPTYALRVWQGSLLPGVLVEKLTLGGAVTFSSAAALTLGAFTVPVYEVYKVGEPPAWREGLDLLGRLDPRLRVAVVPHFDNAEGGTHDTRFCYLGEPRLARLEADLPEDAFVLGVDEHTAVLIDLEAGQVAVEGLGGMTLRVRGRAEVVPAGQGLALEDLFRVVDDLRRTWTGTDGPTPPLAPPSTAAESGPTAAPDPAPGLTRVPGGSPLVRAAREYQARFDEAAHQRDAAGMARAVADLEAELWAWRDDPSQTDDQDRARATLRSLIAELGKAAKAGTRDPAELVGPFVDLVLALRAEARAARRFDQADTLRDGLLALGVEVRDTPDGVTWQLRPDHQGRPSGGGCR